MVRRTLAVLALAALTAPAAAQEADPPFFSLDPASPSLGPDSSADLFGLDDPSGFAVELPAESLGLSSAEAVDALSGGADYIDKTEPCPVILIRGGFLSTLYFWSVDRATVGADPITLPTAIPALSPPGACIVAGSPVPPELPPADPGEGAAGDLFVQFYDTTAAPPGVGARTRLNRQWLDEEELGLADGLPAAIDDLDAAEVFLEGFGTPDFDTDADGISEADVFLSVDPATAAAIGVSPADILVMPADKPPSAREVYATTGDLGLLPGDDIDALCVSDTDTEFSPIPGAPERVAFSLTPGSPSLAGPDGSLGTPDDFSAADVFRIGPGDPFPGSGIQVPFLPHDFLSLEAGDNLDALACLLGDPPLLDPPVPSDGDDPFPPPGFPDCNRNGRDDAEDIATGRSADLNGDDIPDECQQGVVRWGFVGEAEGGEIRIRVQGFSTLCEVVLTTTAGQGAATVAADLAALVNADSCLASQGVTARSSGGELILDGLNLSFRDVEEEINDPGIAHRLLAVPTLDRLGLLLLALLVVVAGLRRLARGAA